MHSFVVPDNARNHDVDVSFKERSLLVEKGETQLWNDFKNGDERAFTQIYRDYVVRLYHYGERITPVKTIIEDSIHDFFVELWKSRNTISHASSVKLYLYKGFRNRLIRNLQKSRRIALTTVTDSYQFEIVLSPEFDIIAQQITDTQKEQLLKAVNKLAPRQKQALTLRFYDELTYEEIAKIMEIPVRSVYMLVYRSVVFLKECLKDVNLYGLIFFLLLN